MSRIPGPLVDSGIFVLLSAVWGTTWAAIRVALEGVPPLGGVAVRFALAGTLLWLLARARGIRLGHHPLERRLWWVQVATTFAGSYTIVYWAEQWVPSALAAVLFATFPVWALLFGRWLLPCGAVRGRELAGALVGFAGILLLFAEDFESLSGSGVTQAAGVLLLAPVLSALGSVAVKRWGQNISPLSMTAVPMLWTGGVVGVFSLFVEGPARWSWQLKPWLATLYLSFVGSALSFVLYFRLLERRSLFVASALSLTIPVVAVLVGVFFLKEPWTDRMTIGTSWILAGVVLGSWRSVESSRGS